MKAIMGSQSGKAYNVDSGNELGIIDLANIVLQIRGIPESWLNSSRQRPGYDRQYATAARKLEHEPGWTPSIQFSRGRADTIRQNGESGK